jgi:CheY-like chemotaxis protein
MYPGEASTGTETATIKSDDGLRILVVEDHDDTRRVLSNLLMHTGHHVAAANCLSAARKVMTEESFDVIVSDIGLPDGSGYALIAEAKQSQPSIRAIALTGFATEQDVRFSREAGFDFHLTKPVDFHQLRTLLTQPAHGASDA